MRNEELRALLHGMAEGILPLLTDRTKKARTENRRQELLDVSAQILVGVAAATGSVEPIGRERTTKLMRNVVDYAEQLIACVDQRVDQSQEEGEEEDDQWLQNGGLPPGATAA